MANISLLFDIILKILVTGLPIAFLVLFFLHRKNRTWAYRYLLSFLLTLLVAVLFLVRIYFVKNSEAEKYIGLYRLHQLDCEVCNNCKVELQSDYTYQIVKGQVVVRSGFWSLELSDMGYYLKIENGSRYRIDESLRRIESISNINCCLYGCKKNLAAEFSAKVVDIRVEGYHYNQKTIFLLDCSKDTIEYFPGYYKHPWIEDTLKVGDFVVKRRNSMDFMVISEKGDTSLIKFKTPDCEVICK